MYIVIHIPTKQAWFQGLRAGDGEFLSLVLPCISHLRLPKLLACPQSVHVCMSDLCACRICVIFVYIMTYTLVCVCVLPCIHIHESACMCEHKPMHAQLQHPCNCCCMHVYACICIYTYTRINAHKCRNTYTPEGTHTYPQAYIHTCRNKYISAGIHTYTHTHTHEISLQHGPCYHRFQRPEQKRKYTYTHTVGEYNITTEPHAQDISADILHVWLSGYILQHIHIHTHTMYLEFPCSRAPAINA